MAKQPAQDLTFKLPAETRKKLEEQQSTLDNIKASLATLKKIGVDTKVLEDQLAWAETARKALLEQF